MSELSMDEVEALWADGRPVPLWLAPIAMWNLIDPPEPLRQMYFMPMGEEALGDEF